jgi:hypothetical protein
MRIIPLDKFYLFLSTPIFKLFFSFDGIIHIFCFFEINEFMTLIFFRESLNFAFSMLGDSTNKIVRHTDIERSGITWHDISEKLIV